MASQRGQGVRRAPGFGEGERHGEGEEGDAVYRAVGHSEDTMVSVPTGRSDGC